MYYYYAWEMIVLVQYKLSFVERLSSSRRVIYWRFHCIRNRGVPIIITSDEDRKQQNICVYKEGRCP